MTLNEKERIRNAARKWAVENGLQEPLKITYNRTTPTMIELQARELKGKERTAALRFTKDGTPAMYELER